MMRPLYSPSVASGVSQTDGNKNALSKTLFNTVTMNKRFSLNPSHPFLPDTLSSRDGSQPIRLAELESSTCMLSDHDTVGCPPAAPFDAFKWLSLLKMNQHLVSDVVRGSAGFVRCFAIARNMIYIGTSRSLVLMYDLGQGFKGTLGSSEAGKIFIFSC